MKGYRYRRIETEELPQTLILAVGLDKGTEGLVMVDLMIPQFKGAYRFTAQQFDMFTYAVVRAAKMAMTFAMLFDCISESLADEDPDVIQRVMDRVAKYTQEYAEEMSGEEPESESEEEIPFDEL
jgi:hypothetical protein